jgi:hypothetical protein
MKLEVKPDLHVAEITLSRRNLRTMLQKLDMAGSARTIYSDGWGPDGTWRLILCSEDDDEHYRDRKPPGPMHPQTEREM